MRIPVIIVDDEEVDRLITQKRLERSEWSDVFKPIQEYDSGDVFLETYDTRSGEDDGADIEIRPLVLMDVNMPRRNGFETIEEMAKRIEAGAWHEGVVVMMFTSSQNPGDIARAEALELVKGYIIKPFDDDDIANIISYYNAGADAKSWVAQGLR